MSLYKGRLLRVGSGGTIALLRLLSLLLVYVLDSFTMVHH